MATAAQESLTKRQLQTVIGAEPPRRVTIGLGGEDRRSKEPLAEYELYVAPSKTKPSRISPSLFSSEVRIVPSGIALAFSSSVRRNRVGFFHGSRSANSAS